MKKLVTLSLGLALAQGVMAQAYTPTEGPVAPTTNIVNVNSEASIKSAIANAQPGQVITIAPGTYTLNGNVYVSKNGTSTNRIFLRAATRGSVTLRTNSLEGFNVKGQYWVFENLKVQGGCSTPSTSCEHAVHIVQNADNVIFRYNEFVNYSSHFKLNQQVDSSGVQQFPDRLWIIKNKFYNTTANTFNGPHNPLNIDGGDYHVVRGNIIADYASGLSAKPASAIYPKSGTRYMMAEQNLIVCKKNVMNSNTVRGIYMGDGTMASAWPVSRPANVYGENVQGTFRNNVILNCTGDGSSAGIFVGDDSGSKILHNTSVNSKAMFLGAKMYTTTTNRVISPTQIRRNALNNGFTYWGDASTRPFQMADNFVMSSTTQSGLFVGPTTGDLTLKYLASGLSNKVTVESTANYDFCGNLREPTTDLGAIEYDHVNAQACVNKIKAMYNYTTYKF